MTATTAAGQPDGVLEHQGLLWRPKQGATTTAEVFLAARDLFLALNEESRWNPWVLEDRADDLEQAMSVMAQWTRAEPGHRTLTKRQVDARLARWDREYDRRRAAEDERYKQDSERYNREREAARLSLLEKQSRLAHELDEVAALRSGESFPVMDPAKRAEQAAESDESIEKLRAQIDRLRNTVGDPEDVVDQHGRLPRDRRAMMLTLFRAHRSVEVRQLRTKVPELTAAVKEAKDKKERAEVRQELDRATRRLDKLLAIPPLTADDMCSECATPAAQHGWRTSPADGPCPAWPGWAARVRKARRMLESFARQRQEREPEPPKPKPLAVVPSGLPIAEVIEQLTELQAKYPNSEVRRGRSNRWELWPRQSND